MIKIEFICHGNICRSPMAEFILKRLVARIGLTDEFDIKSAATSREEIGNSVYPPVKELLKLHGLICDQKRACQITSHDVKYYDYIIAMDDFNLENIYTLFPNADKSKFYKLLDFTDSPKDIDDPWYTRDFQRAFDEIKEGCVALLISLNQDSIITLKKNQLNLLKEPL